MVSAMLSGNRNEPPPNRSFIHAQAVVLSKGVPIRRPMVAPLLWRPWLHTYMRNCTIIMPCLRCPFWGIEYGAGTTVRNSPRIPKNRPPDNIRQLAEKNSHAAASCAAVQNPRVLRAPNPQHDYIRYSLHSVPNHSPAQRSGKAHHLFLTTNTKYVPH